MVFSLTLYYITYHHPLSSTPIYDISYNSLYILPYIKNFREVRRGIYGREGEEEGLIYRKEGRGKARKGKGRKGRKPHNSHP
jgi:hypothetical protein